MVTEADLPGLTLRVLGAAFALGLAFGALAQRTHFCTMGAVADIVSMGDWSRMRMWALAAGTAVLGFNGMVWLGWVKAADTIYAASSLMWLSLLLGGLLFGAGMVLASGCGNKTLVRLGAGNLKSLVVMLVTGVSAWATMRGVTALARVATVDKVQLALPAPQDLPSLLAPLGGSSGQRALVLGLVVGGALLLWALARPEGRRGEVLAGGTGVGLLVVALWWVSGVLGHLPEHPVTLERAFLATASQRMESFSMVAPMAYLLEWLVYASDVNRKLGLGAVAALGVVGGSALAAVAGRSFRWEGFANVGDLARHLGGAVLMGVGGITALGCTVGQGITGLSTLSLGSLLALAGILAGAAGMLRWQVWRLERALP